LKTFSPKFDVKEAADAYELHGELLGIKQEDIKIEFTDAQ
jgi:HSP20 family molecular chaperone IbpA